MAASIPNSAIYHSSHDPKHPITLVDNDAKSFQCDGCCTQGMGKRYQCKNNCYYNLHEFCGTCPSMLSSFLHPKHQLYLVLQEPKHMRRRQSNMCCNICSERIEGAFYQCRNSSCDFDVHPLCTQIHKFVHHALDANHQLMFQPPKPHSQCKICNRRFTLAWCYRCKDCSIDIHVECLFVNNTLIQPPPAVASHNMWSPSVAPQPLVDSPSIFHPMPPSPSFVNYPSPFLIHSPSNSSSFSAHPYNNAFNPQLSSAHNQGQWSNVVGSPMLGNGNFFMAKFAISMLNNIAGDALTEVVFGGSIDWLSQFL